jgi:hypothetical protein
MTKQPGQPQPAAEADDLEYDLAHEDPHAAEHRTVAHSPVYVATETAGYDGDYGYDLAHDVPGR